MSQAPAITAHVEPTGCYGSSLAFKPKSKTCSGCDRKKDCSDKVFARRPAFLKLLARFDDDKGKTMDTYWYSAAERKQRKAGKTTVQLPMKFSLAHPGTNMIYPLLGVRTDFSLGESIISTGELPQIALDADTSVVGVVDTMSVNALITATKKLKANDQRLLLGVRIRVIMKEDADEDKDDKEKACYLKLYPTNEQGIRCLYKLLSRGFDPTRFYYVPRVTWGDLTEHLENDCLVISTGDLESVVQRGDMQRALTQLCSDVQFVSRFYELVPSETPYFSRQNNCAINYGELNGFEPIVVAPAFWLNNNREAFSCNAGIADRRPYVDYLAPVPDFQPHTVVELVRASLSAAKALDARYTKNTGSTFSAGLRNTAKLVELCSYTWVKQEPSLPVLAANPISELTNMCKAGWLKRFSSPVLAHQPTNAELAADYMPRLKFELETLNRLGFASYFLLVADLVTWAKAQGIYVGPGRGSVGGSLVSYLIGITDVDPIRFKLLFERFINPDRLDLPDADLDFMSTRREEVIEYLNNKYGSDKVAGIVNYNTMAARSSIRDVARIYGVQGDKLGATKYISETHGVFDTLEQAFETTPEIQEFAKGFPRVWDNAVKLQGKMRAYGTHAAGVVVAAEPLTNRAVVERRGDMKVINWDKSVSEEQGLIKLDVLGLTTLDMFDHAIKLIRTRHSIAVDINAISLDDEATLEIFNTARTAAIFQFESGSVRRLLKEMADFAPLTFNDLVALNALNRPGPLDAGITESYIKRRAGKETVTYPHPVVEPYLKETYGVICYQEQVMQVARALCGFTPGEADTLRKIMGKKLPVEMAKQRDKFVDGAISTSNMAPIAADRLFSDIEKFAGYAFNLSHAVEYTLIAFQAAYLKAHYLVEFYTASMGIAGDEKLAVIAKQAAQDGIRVIPPDINISTDRFEPVNDTIIIAPLSVVLNVSDKGANAIVRARDAKKPVLVEITTGRGKNKVTTQETFGPGRFVSLEDFKARVPSKSVNARAIDNLNRVGAFARITPGQLSSTDPARQRDQIELMPAISDQGVRAERAIPFDDLMSETIMDIEAEMRAAMPGKATECHMGQNPKMMVVLDAPPDDRRDLASAYSFENFIQPSLEAAGLTIDDAVWTWVIRRPKHKGERDLPVEEITQCLPFLHREISAMKPPVIVLLGAQAIKTFSPDLKRPADHIGRKTFSAEFDATTIIGFNPGMIYFDDAKRETLTEVFAEAKTLLDETY